MNSGVESAEKVRPGRRRPIDSCSRYATVLTLWLVALAAAPATVQGACNLIPPAEQAFPSTLGSVTSPITTVGSTVELRLAPCDGSAGFDPTPANNQITIAFVPGGPSQVVPGGSITVADCTATCQTLRFTTP